MRPGKTFRTPHEKQKAAVLSLTDKPKIVAALPTAGRTTGVLETRNWDVRICRQIKRRGADFQALLTSGESLTIECAEKPWEFSAGVLVGENLGRQKGWAVRKCSPAFGNPAR